MTEFPPDPAPSAARGSSLAVVVLAAGKGTRMRSSRPKVLHEIAGRSMLGHVLAAAGALEPQRIVVVVGPDMEAVTAAARPHQTMLQTAQRGTGDAVRSAWPALEAAKPGTVLVLFGDTPLVTPQTLRQLAAAREAGAAVVVAGIRFAEPGAYGRLILDAEGNLVRIVEAADATPEERAVTLCNAGVMAVDGALLPGFLEALQPHNAAGEYYLTDLVGLARAAGQTARVVEAEPGEMMGVNSRAELAAAEAEFQRRRRAEAMRDGVTLTDPASVFFAADTRLGRDVAIGPSVVFGPGVTIEDEVEIKSFSHIEGATIRRGAIVGPFARLRPGSDVGEGAHVGNFVELKNTRLGQGAKANHLTYLGDADVGRASNVGAGTITCNYDGYFKHRTVIGEEVFIGSDTALVAPVTVGDRAMVAAGSVITHDVEPDATAIARGAQVNKSGHAKRFRAERLALKAAHAAAKAKSGKEG